MLNPSFPIALFPLILAELFEGCLLARRLCTALLFLPQFSRAAFLLLVLLLNGVTEERNQPGYGLCKRCSTTLTVYRL